MPLKIKLLYQRAILKSLLGSQLTLLITPERQWTAGVSFL